MKMKITEDPDFPKLIDAYRNNILTKYGKENLENYPEFQALSEEKIEIMTQYFMKLLYPEWEERQRLDSAFGSLKGFVQKPSKVFGLIGSLGLSLWKIGKYLPEAFRAGLAALSSYLAAHEMEAELLREAKPYILRGENLKDEKIFRKLLPVIPKDQAEKFRKDIVSLFKTLTNEILVDRIVMIMANLVEKMKSKQDLYTTEDIEGISLGLSILQQGKSILEKLNDEEKNLMLSAIDRIEKDYYESAQI